MERLAELLDARPSIVSPTALQPLPPGPLSVSFDRVCFAYPTRSRDKVLRQLSFSINAGETVAIVGPSGAGKSTLFQLLLRFYDPGAGCVSVGGVDVRELDMVSLREKIGVVPQDVVMFSGTAAENIAYGCPDATTDEIQKAARQAHASEFIERMPDKYQTFLGERGVRLSGGQRDRKSVVEGQRV